ncbi:DUF3299 domain-containing protein [Sulfitobacter sp. D35]|uniref:HoxN/HupN/NixA family nickel/cobalt transporter n=1 Tax=Sulfitobacter sp. D35 TaxID=3083252 RepID=UPI00296E5742|nr:DUF3299 domain-containing protein [Sulfitobacter sp. D35]MDW4496413.1 DUF3299 domain-containing protein [Sulfitobacter sp. D35]
MLAVLWLLPSAAVADTPDHVLWDDLAPLSVPYDDPFLEMSYKQKDDLRTVFKASQKHDDPTLATAAEASRARLSADGYDADRLLEQRLVVMERRREEATGVTSSFLGKSVTLDGYVLPLRGDKGYVYSFLLVPWVGACIHTPPPPPNQMIRVDVPDGIKIDEAFHAVRLRGVLEHAPTVSNLFLVDGQRVVEASYTLNNATIWGEPDEIQISSAAAVQGNLFARGQAWISNLFGSSMNAMAEGSSFGTFAVALSVAFLYGVLHTLGPGHGKAVVISYFVGEGGTLRRGIGMGIRIALVHVFSAVVAVYLLDLAIRQTTGGPASDYRIVRLSSYALIIAIGLWMTWKSLVAFRTNRLSASSEPGHDHPIEHAHSDGAHVGCAACAAAQKSASRSDGWLATAVGIVPCTGALIVMLFSLANDLVMPAIAMVAAISAGMAIAMSAIGVAAIWTRSVVARRVEDRDRNMRFDAMVRLGGATCVLLTGLLLFATTWTAPTGSSALWSEASARAHGQTASVAVE